jgi:hypothetical protein
MPLPPSLSCPSSQRAISAAKPEDGTTITAARTNTIKNFTEIFFIPLLLLTIELTGLIQIQNLLSNINAKSQYLDLLNRKLPL